MRGNGPNRSKLQIRTKEIGRAWSGMEESGKMDHEVVIHVVPIEANHKSGPKSWEIRGPGRRLLVNPDQKAGRHMIPKRKRKP